MHLPSLSRLPTGTRSKPILAALALQLMAGAAAAQVASVTVRDAQTGAPVGSAMVRMEDAAGFMVRAGFTRPDGTVRLRVPAGSYRVSVRRAGYHEGSAPLQVGTGEAALEVGLRPRPFSLDTVVVVAPGDGVERGRDAFLRRSRSEDGVFLDPAYLQQRYHSTFIGDLLYGVPDVMIVAEGCDRGRASRMATGCAGRLTPRVPVGRRGWGCFIQLINGELPRMTAFDADLGHDQIDFWYDPRDMVGVEVYYLPSDVPQELRRFAQPRCGMINYWTRSRW